MGKRETGNIREKEDGKRENRASKKKKVVIKIKIKIYTKQK
jgi:hypothetical protein